MKHALTQEGEPCSTIPHPFQELQLMYLPFHYPLSMDECSSSQDCFFISLDAANHPLKFTDLALSHALQPGVQAFSLAVTKHAHEILRQFIDYPGKRTGLANNCQFCLLSSIEIVRVANEQPDGLARGKLLEGCLWECLHMFSPALR
jgi:hypothetical protein